MRIAAVDYEVVRLQVRHQVAYHAVDYGPGGNKHHDIARRLELVEEIIKVFSCRNRQSGAFYKQKLLLFDIEVGADAGNAVLGNIQKKIAAHRPEADHPEMCFSHKADYTSQMSAFTTPPV